MPPKNKSEWKRIDWMRHQLELIDNEGMDYESAYYQCLKELTAIDRQANKNMVPHPMNRNLFAIENARQGGRPRFGETAREARARRGNMSRY